MRKTLLTIAILALIVPLVACTSTGDTNKTVTFEPGSINLHPFPYPVREVTTETGEVRYEMILPDGTYQVVQGMPNMNNLTLVNNLSDVAEQTTDVKTDAEIDADANVNSPGSATGGSDASPTEVPIANSDDG